jgi:hypothetical protein
MKGHTYNTVTNLDMHVEIHATEACLSSVLGHLYAILLAKDVRPVCVLRVETIKDSRKIQQTKDVEFL